jgi:NAD(P)-dependent dehydrogenase (short-subunit alcohol dehydrogenase family)
MGRILDERYALVTGASRGIGRALAEVLGRAGCNIAVASRSREDCEAVAGRIAREHSVRAFPSACDVTSSASVRALFVALRKWSGDRLDVLVCNAGYRFVPEIWNTPLDATPPEKLEEWYRRVFETDTLGSVFSTYEALPLMKAQGHGSIIYISSTPALEGFQGPPYTVAKAGVLGLMRDVARAYGRLNVRANALALGNIKTPATFESLDPGTRQAMAEESALGRWGLPEEVGGAALFLASDLSSFVTGQTLVVDGGAVRR